MSSKNDESHYSLLPHDSDGDSTESPRPCPRCRIKSFIPWIFHALLLVIYAIAFALLYYYHSTERPASNAIEGYESIYSDVTPDLFRTAPWTFESGSGNEGPDDKKSIYIQPPSPEVDAAWLEFQKVDAVYVSEEEAALLETPTARYKGNYTVSPDVFHQLHCLNAIRMNLEPTHYHGKHGYSQEKRKEHIYHCIDQIRQALMCAADITPLSVRPEGGEFWFRGTHQCRNIEKIMEWARKRAVPLDA